MVANKMIKQIWGVFCVLTFTIAVLLFWQYRFLTQQVQILQEAKEKYEEHVAVLKQVIADTIVNGSLKNAQLSVPEKEKEKLKQALLTYLKQKDANIDIQDLEELYRSFSRTIKVEHPKKTQKVVAKKREQKRNRFLMWPLDKDKFWISSFFGRRKLDNGKWTTHFGLDLAALTGTPIKAAANGKVLEAGNGNGYGNTILLLHNKYYKTRYAHLNRIRVRRGQFVKRGQIIGTVGATGNVRGNGTDASHLHFEVHQGNKQVNPFYYLS